jgi:hypothetical protein
VEVEGEKLSLKFLAPKVRQADSQAHHFLAPHLVLDKVHLIIGLVPFCVFHLDLFCVQIDPPPIAQPAPTVLQNTDPAISPSLPKAQAPPGEHFAFAKCCLRGCTGFSSFQVSCSANDCNKRIHSFCFEKMLEKNCIEKLEDPHTKVTLWVCSKGCHKKMEKKINGQPSRLPWSMDGPNGPDDPVNSEAIIMEWLLTEGNYAKFRGNNDGTRKLAIGKQLSLMFKEKGCKVERTPQAVVKKFSLWKTHSVWHMIGPTTPVRESRNQMVMQSLTSVCANVASIILSWNPSWLTEPKLVPR